CRDCSNLHCAPGMDDRDGAEADPNYLACTGRWFCRSRNFILASAAFFLERRPESCDWNIDFSRLNFRLVRKLPLLARRKACRLAISHCCSTNDLWRNLALVRQHCHRRAPTIFSQYHLDEIGRLICLSGDYWSCGGIHRLHLAPAPL